MARRTQSTQTPVTSKTDTRRLSWHKAAKRYFKKYRGRFWYFSDDFEHSWDEWQRLKSAVDVGRDPHATRQSTAELRLGDICNGFLSHKEAQRDNGELAPRTFKEYYDACQILVREFGKHRLVSEITVEDFATLRQKLAKRFGAAGLAGMIVKCRMPFAFATRQGWLLKPATFGESFSKPKKKAIRREKIQRPEKLFAPAEIHQLLAAATQPLKSFVLLGCNAALGAGDLASLEFRHVDLESGYCNFPRPKTAIAREFILWPESIDAIRAWLKQRPQPKDSNHADLIFLTARRQPWTGTGNYSAVTGEFRKLATACGLRVEGRGHYALRHSFRSAIDHHFDQRGIDRVMGHTSQHMSAAYVEYVSRDRLKVISDIVHAWLFAEKVEG